MPTKWGWEILICGLSVPTKWGWEILICGLSVEPMLNAGYEKYGAHGEIRAENTMVGKAFPGGRQ